MAGKGEEKTITRNRKRADLPYPEVVCGNATLLSLLSLLLLWYFRPELGLSPGGETIHGSQHLLFSLP